MIAKMLVQLLPSSPHRRSIFAAIVFITLPTAHSDDRELFSRCSRLYSCGQTVRNIGYPFWGGDRPDSCGLPGLELTCLHEDGGNYSTLDIIGGKFRVLSADPSIGLLTIAHDGLWSGMCPGQFNNSMFAETILAPSTSVSIQIFHGCSPSINASSREAYTCSYNEEEITGLYDNASCPYNISVPVLRSALQQFQENKSMTLEQVLKQGFNVEYGAFSRASCVACEGSGGACWSGTSYPNSTCLCPNGGTPHLSCSGNTGRVKLKVLIATVTGGPPLILLAICLVIYTNKKSSSSIALAFLWKKRTETDIEVEKFIKQCGSFSPKRYGYSEIKKMTDSFKDKIGQGGYGSVYKGRIAHDHGRLVAVKVLNQSKGTNGEEFINEVASIGRTSHVHIVTLLGFCYNGDKRALVYEFMLNGSLDKFIYSTSSTTGQALEPQKLYQIAVGIARGLEYLHGGCNTGILHLDIKPQNILLDDDFCPKISDFGLAKLYSRDKSNVSTTLEARGTIGYIAPEVFNRTFGRPSAKSDVYSYGMLLLEMVGGRNKRSDEGDLVDNCSSSEIYFPDCIYRNLELNQDVRMPGFVTEEENEIARKMLLVGLWCIQMIPSERPSMKKVLEMLEGSPEMLKLPSEPFASSPQRAPIDSFTSVSSDEIMIANSQ